MSAVRLLESIVRDMKKQLADHTAEHEAVCEQLRLANIDQANTEAKLNDAKRDLATVQGERERFRKALEVVTKELVTHEFCGDAYPEDGWPEVQAALRVAKAALAQPAAPSARGRMHSCDIPECVACGNPPDIEEKQEGRDELR